jgi:hypothetical protein
MADKNDSARKIAPERAGRFPTLPFSLFVAASLQLAVFALAQSASWKLATTGANAAPEIEQPPVQNRLGL